MGANPTLRIAGSSRMADTGIKILRCVPSTAIIVRYCCPASNERRLLGEAVVFAGEDHRGNGYRLEARRNVPPGSSETARGPAPLEGGPLRRWIGLYPRYAKSSIV